MMGACFYAAQFLAERFMWEFDGSVRFASCSTACRRSCDVRNYLALVEARNHAVGEGAIVLDEQVSSGRRRLYLLNAEAISLKLTLPAMGGERR